MFHYKSLENCDLLTIYKTFKAAFSDYVIPMNPELSQFESILIRRGYVPALSMGAFKGDQLVGFIFSSCRIWNDKKTLYTIGVGVIPAFRGQKIAEKLYQELFLIGSNAGIEQYLLEVITRNFSAIKLYKKLGFKPDRTLRCFELKKALPALSLEKIALLSDQYQISLEAQLPNLTLEKLIDYSASWQYSLDSINTDPQSFHYVIARMKKEIVGVLIVDSQTGTIFQIGIDPAHRRQQLATAMLIELQKIMPEKCFSFSNIDDRNHSLMSFIESLGFEHLIDQYEMLKIV